MLPCPDDVINVGIGRNHCGRASSVRDNGDWATLLSNTMRDFDDKFRPPFFEIEFTRFIRRGVFQDVDQCPRSGFGRFQVINLGLPYTFANVERHMLVSECLQSRLKLIRGWLGAIGGWNGMSFFCEPFAYFAGYRKCRIENAQCSDSQVIGIVV